MASYNILAALVYMYNCYMFVELVDDKPDTTSQYLTAIGSFKKTLLRYGALYFAQ